MAARLTPCVGVMIITPILGLGGSYAKRSERNYRVPGSHYAQRERSGVGHNGPAIKQVAEGNLPEGRSDRRERSFIACWALLNGA